MITEIVPGICYSEHQVAEGKNGIILGERGTLLIDAGSYPHEAQVMADYAAAHGRPPQRLIFTHSHGDHIMGSSAFEVAEVISHAGVPGEIRRRLPGLAETYHIPADQLEAQLAWPTLTFDGELNLDLGGWHVRLQPAPGHSPDGIVIFVEEARALFAGDTVVTGIVPAIHEGDSRALEATLTDLSAMDIELLVPGHGPLLCGREQIADWLRWTIGYLSAVRAFARDALDRGEDPARIAGQAAYEEFVGGRLAPDKHHMRERHQDTVDKIVREELLDQSSSPAGGSL